MMDPVKPLVTGDAGPFTGRGEPTPLRVAVTGPGKTDVLNCLVMDLLFPFGFDKVETELHYGLQPQLRVFKATEDTGAPWLVVDLQDCTMWKVLQRGAYLQHTFNNLADVAIHPAAHRLELHFPFRSPFGDCAVVLTNAEDSANADVVFSTAASSTADCEDMTLHSPTGICRGLRPRNALLCFLCGTESDSTKYFRTVTNRVLQKAVRQAWARCCSDPSWGPSTSPSSSTDV